MTLFINNPKTGWSNATEVEVVSVDMARATVAKQLATNKKLQFSLIYNKKTFHWKKSEFVDIVHDQPIWAWFTEVS